MPSWKVPDITISNNYMLTPMETSVSFLSMISFSNNITMAKSVRWLLHHLAFTLQFCSFEGYVDKPVYVPLIKNESLWSYRKSHHARNFSIVTCVCESTTKEAEAGE